MHMINKDKSIKKLSVIGAGSWGSALAIHAAKARLENNIVPHIALWGHRLEHVLAMQAAKQNRQYLPDIIFPDNLYPTPNLSEALHNADAILLAVPSKAFEQTLLLIKQTLQDENKEPVPILYATKGLEHGTGRFLHDVIEQHFKGISQAILSGPSFAKEVAINLPTAVCIASSTLNTADFFMPLFHHNCMRIYTNTDVIGVELGCAYKNVIAIAAGITDGLGFGANARAALITRGLAEMQRLGIAVGGRPETFMGLTGLGDLLLTATDDQSRNRRFGIALGRGDDPKQAQQSIGQVVEGASTAIEILRLAHQYKIELPIVEQTYDVIYKNVKPKDAVLKLLLRDPRAE
ncbi:glycerol-3-phosphate dehydrogenase [Gammaproteobacteria bacterium]|nr:glycerol-3-phosphate dehydrogenase [Gammaproteobacteria bacterium]